MKVEIYKKRKRIKTYAVTGVAHFGVVRDYILTTDCGVEIEIDADIITEIVKHEKQEVKP